MSGGGDAQTSAPDGGDPDATISAVLALAAAGAGAAASAAAVGASPALAAAAVADALLPPAVPALPTSEAATHPGTVRARNEDAVVDRPDLGLWAVADGAGGHGAGDVASAAVADALNAVPPGLSAAELLAQIRLRLHAVNADLRARAAALGEGRVVATTVVVLLARGGHHAVLWAGDSRAYRLRGGVLSRLTRDHSVVQEMVDAGEIAEAEADGHPRANVITRAVGGADALDLDKASGRVAPGDLYLLCSDGLVKALAEAEVAALLARGGGAAGLVEAAVAAGARDNVSAVAVRPAPG